MFCVLVYLYFCLCTCICVSASTVMMIMVMRREGVYFPIVVVRTETLWGIFTPVTAHAYIQNREKCKQTNKQRNTNKEALHKGLRHCIKQKYFCKKILYRVLRTEVLCERLWGIFKPQNSSKEEHVQTILDLTLWKNTSGSRLNGKQINPARLGVDTRCKKVLHHKQTDKRSERPGLTYRQLYTCIISTDTCTY